MKRLIVNADDFGMAESVTLGIIKGHQEGIITSTSLLAGGTAAGHAASLAKDNPTLGVGIHLCLTIERPVSMPEYIPSLAGNGRLPAGPMQFALGLFSGSIKTAEIETELSAQIERAIQLGIKPTHLDGHQHLIMLGPVFRIVLKLAKEYGIGAVRYPVGPWNGLYCPLRTMEKLILEGMAKSQRQRLDESVLKRPDYFFGLPETGNMNVEKLAAIIESLTEGTSEVMCHPGLPNPSLAKEINWGKGWETELEAVTDSRVQELVKAKGIELINFGQL